MSYKDLFQPANEAAAVLKKNQKGDLSCTACGLYKKVNHPNITFHGEGKKNVLIVGEAPGETEDQLNKQWQGKVGKYFQGVLRKEFGFKMFEDGVCINSVNCRPPQNRKPTPKEIDCCRKEVFNAIKKVKPNVIILAGGSAIESVIGVQWKKSLDGVTRWRGFRIPDQTFKAWVCPTFHPSYVQRMSDYPQVELLFKQDLKNALSLWDTPVIEFPNWEDMVSIITNKKEVLKLLNSIVENQPEYLAFDYETTGLKPHDEGHKIVCASISFNGHSAFAFPLKGKKIKRVWKQILTNNKIKKFAHNMQYEDTWTKEILGYNICGWEWDSMVAAHIKDNRKKITGLKFQSCVHFGVYDYSSEVEPYLKSKDSKNGNSKNRIMDLVEKPGGMDKLLLYCGIDSLLEYRLAMIQRNQML